MDSNRVIRDINSFSYGGEVSGCNYSTNNDLIIHDSLDLALETLIKDSSNKRLVVGFVLLMCYQ